MSFSTKDQRFYTTDGQMKAEIDVYLSPEDVEGNPSPPPIANCRHAILQIENGSKHNAYVVYDRLLGRIVNGVYYSPLSEVLDSAAHYNEDLYAPQDMAPNGVALGLKYPPVKRGKNIPLVVEDRQRERQEDEQTQPVKILRHLDRLLKEATCLHAAIQKEERANRRRKVQKWDEQEKLAAKLTELEAYLNPDDAPTGLHPMYCDDPSFECYVLVSD